MNQSEMSPPDADGAEHGAIRDQILTAVIKLIAEHGIDGMTMRQVAEASCLSTGTINYHFRNKRGLVIAALERAYQLPSDGEGFAGTAQEKLQRFTRGFLLDDEATRDWWRFWLDYSAHAARDAELRHHEATRFTRQLKYFEGVLQAGIAAGEVPAALGVTVAADMLLTLAYGLAIRQTVLSDSDTREEARRVLKAAIGGTAIPRRPTG